VNVSEPAPAVPEGVIVQSLVVHGDGERAGYRIYGDGRYQTLARGAGEWVDGPSLDRSRLERVERALDAERLDDLAGRYEGASGEGEPNVLWMQVAHGGPVRSVSVVGDRRVPELARLTVLLTDAFRELS
jgi:hypothetical protein